ncbi:MAG: phosphoribosylglycinamide formyltransferase [Halobacteriales archaeon]|nr:phosphoribosylglycinamide formyltransferase [Halobacteriales archaeon]
MLQLGVLASASGTNLQAILDACHARRIDAQVAVVISDRRDARALDRAKHAGVPIHFSDPAGRPREEHDAQMTDILEDAGVGLVCMAGYMRIVTPVLLAAFPDRVVNVHPALLPAFPGLRAQRQALQAGVRIAGCTTHLVDEQVDHGPILMQAAVPVLPDDDEHALSMRILEQEHILYPQTIQLFAGGRVEVRDGKAVIKPKKDLRGDEALRSPPG